MGTLTNKDILESLNKTPYSVPEGYFESFKENMKPKDRKFNLVPYLSLAAMFVVIALSGTMILKATKEVPSDDIYSAFYYSDLLPTIEEGLFSYESYGQEGANLALADNDVTDENLIDYMIYAGTSIELINME